MRYANIPKTDLKPSIIAFGTVQLGSELTRDDSFLLLDRYVELGGTFIDTAKIYADWVPGERSASEKMIGRWLKERGNRDRLVLATKGGMRDENAPEVGRLTPEALASDVHASLSHLQTDYIDLYYLHRDEPTQPVETIIETLNVFVREGKIRYFACSNWTAERIAAAEAYARQFGLQGFSANQNRWSLAVYPDKGQNHYVTMTETEKAYHLQTGMAAVPFNSQAFGLFSLRDWSGDAPIKERVRKLLTDVNIRRLECVSKWSERLGINGTRIALAYLTSQPFSVFPIIGPKALDQLEDSCAAGDLSLSCDIVRELDQIN